MFAAADAREGHFSPESEEPLVAPEPLSEGCEVVEDHRTIQLSLRGHLPHFLREDLATVPLTGAGLMPDSPSSEAA